MKINHWKKIVTFSVASLALVGCETAENGNGEEVADEEIEEEVEIDEVEEGEYTADGTGVVDEEGQVGISDVHVDVSTEVTDAVGAVDEAVVSIINLQDIDPWGEFGDIDDELDTEEDLAQAGTGSGAVYKVDDDTAYIFTNNHVIEGSDAVDVMFKDGSREEATLVGGDLWTDLAVLEVDAENVTSVAEFGDSENLTVGEPAVAIGSPLGTEFASSVTTGIISAVGRTVPVDTTMDGEYDWEMTAIQTDAAINPGNSGGPLVNIAGQVVGINSMQISGPVIEGMGFAIPSNDAVDIINELEEYGEIIRPVIGVGMVDLTMVSEEQRVNVLNLPEDVTEGVVIAEVSEGSPAAEAGLETEDVIVEFNGVEVASGMELRQEIYDTEIGDEVEVEFYRDGELETATMTMQADDESL